MQRSAQQRHAQLPTVTGQRTLTRYACLVQPIAWLMPPPNGRFVAQAGRRLLRSLESDADGDICTRP
jgi:hypothetical protein